MPPGVAPLSGLVRMATMNGSVVPGTLVTRLEEAGDEVEARREIAVDTATDLCRRLLDAGAPGLHLYALNRSEAVLRIVDNLGLAPGR
jgi:methylenetetrahydrofolate reductase (NADPH)